MTVVTVGPDLGVFGSILRVFGPLRGVLKTFLTAKSDLVRQTILMQVEQFTLGDLAAQVPSASTQLIKKILAELKKKGKIRLVGKGRGARWEIIPY